MAAEPEIEVSEAAEQYKQQGNIWFKKKDYVKAKQLYTRAIEAGGKNVPVYHNNRATVQYKMENYGAAESDATVAIQGGFKKGYYRRGQSRVALQKLKKAVGDFKKAIQFYPKNRDCKNALKATQKALKEELFIEAISTEEKPISQRLTVDSFKLPKNYTGPVFPEEMTLQWVLDLITYFKSEHQLASLTCVKLLQKALEIFKSLPSIVDLEHTGSMNVCGDTHGQFYDLIHIFEVAGYPSPSNPFIFNGDFVDRGSFSCEVILTLLSWKILYPDHFHLTRGNHETVAMTSLYGFQGECDSKFSREIYELFMETFNYLPLGIVLGEKVLVVHGGLPREEGVSLDDLRSINRATQPPNTGYMCDLLWADPRPEPGFAPSPRGVSHHFGPDISHRFLDFNGLKYLVRSHEMKSEGYEVLHDGRVITIFSAPNYCDQMGNKGAYIKFDAECEPNYIQFGAQPHPNVKPMQYAQGFSFLN